ncbi:MAG: conjugal transfer protein TraR [Ignavibacteriaceae bacterium]|nr:conjugal transfer protein TraR [Ignavibacteriaceae bacterium]
MKKPSAAKAAKAAAKPPKVKKTAEDIVPKKSAVTKAVAEKAKGSKTEMKETKKEVKETKKKTADSAEKPKTARASKKAAEPKEAKKTEIKTVSVAPPAKAEPNKPEVPPKRPIVLTKKYDKDDLEHFRRIILDKRAEIVRQIQNLQEQMKDPTTGEYINENSPYSLHMAEQGTDAMEREKTYLYIQRETKFLTYLDDALERIDAGTYGVCIECIDEPKNLCPTCPLISKQRLEAVPHSKLCVEIKKLQEKTRR